MVSGCSWGCSIQSQVVGNIPGAALATAGANLTAAGDELTPFKVGLTNRVAHSHTKKGYPTSAKAPRRIYYLRPRIITPTAPTLLRRRRPLLKAPGPLGGSHRYGLFVFAQVDPSASVPSL